MTVQRNALFIDMFDQDFVTLLREQLGEETEALLQALETEQETSVRLNDRKLRPDELAEYRREPVEWCPHGWYLSERPQFSRDPLFHAGTYYVQEASSMYLWAMLEKYVAKDAKVLDCCAAPGGKSTLVSQYLGEEGFLLSNEFVAKRANILVENILKWGRSNVAVTNETVDHLAKLGEIFDCVVVDAPCSGEGMFRKDEEARREWSLKNVEMCVERQREILQPAWQTLREGGVMVYSTCTFNRKENEENVEWIEKELDGEVLEMRHFYPHKSRGEGLFMSVIRKKTGQGIQIKGKRLSLVKEKAEWLKEPEEFVLVENKGIRYAIDKRHLEIEENINAAGLNVFVHGVQYAELKGKEWIPAAGLALNESLDDAKFAKIETDKELALKYLRCEAIQADNVAKGIVLVEHQGHPLGWAKNVGNRCNNLYPQYWRLRN